MRNLFTLALLVLVIIGGGCTAPAVAPVAPSPGPSPTTAGPAATESAAPTVTAAANDVAPPALVITVDQAEISWDSQAVVTVRASDPAGIKELAVLLGDQVLATGEGEELRFDFIPGAVDGPAGATSHDLVARAVDRFGNAAEAAVTITVGAEPGETPVARSAAEPTVALSPAPPAATTVIPTGSPSAEPTRALAGAPSAVAPTSVIPGDRGTTSYRVTEIQLPTYPYAAYLKPAVDPERVDYPLSSFDRAAYSASNPQPQLKTYRLLVLENRYIRLGILPDLGGRIYECIFKPTGANEFYANRVVKPTTWGPGSPPYPSGAAWWLAVGGLEWSFPVDEHGYEFATVWGFDHASLDDDGVMITLFTRTGPENPYAVVDIILPPDTAYFVVQPRIVNPLGADFRFKFWENAMLAPGKANSVSSDLRLIFPATQVMMHSTGDTALPQSGQLASWPVVNGRDLSRLGNWSDYLGVFAAPATANFAAVYDPRADEGMVRVFPASQAKGVKLFAPRGAGGLDSALWTDDGSSYVELHGGITPTFAEWHELGPGEEVSWSEYWYPVAKIGGVTFANDRAAMSLMPSAGGVRLGLFPTTATSGQLTLTLPGEAPAVFSVQMSPDQPLVRDFPLKAVVGQRGEVGVTLDDSGDTVFEWKGVAQLR